MGVSYVYKWTHLPTRKWYVGSRTHKLSRLDDGYMCSSKVVKPLIQQNPQDWKRDIVAVGSVDEVRELETELLTAADAKNDARSFNKHNQDGKFVCTGHSLQTIEKIKARHAFAGRPRPAHSAAMTGRKRKPEDVAKWADSMRGRPKTLEHRKNLKVAKVKGLYKTPAGDFTSSRDAAAANGCVKSSVLQKCHGFVCSRGKWYGPTPGWVFIPKEAL
jgi:hypothetical protein